MNRRTYGLEPACCAAWRAFSALVLAINNSLVRLATFAEHIPGNRRGKACLPTIRQARTSRRRLRREPCDSRLRDEREPKEIAARPKRPVRSDGERLNAPATRGLGARVPGHRGTTRHIERGKPVARLAADRGEVAAGIYEGPSGRNGPDHRVAPVVCVRVPTRGLPGGHVDRGDVVASLATHRIEMPRREDGVPGDRDIGDSGLPQVEDVWVPSRCVPRLGVERGDVVARPSAGRDELTADVDGLARNCNRLNGGPVAGGGRAGVPGGYLAGGGVGGGDADPRLAVDRVEGPADVEGLTREPEFINDAAIIHLALGLPDHVWIPALCHARRGVECGKTNPRLAPDR